MSESFISTALQELTCPKCERPLLTGLSGGFEVKLDRILLTKFDELQIQLGGGRTYRLETSSKGTTASYRGYAELKAGINRIQPMVVSAHVCKESEIINVTIPF